MTLARGVNRAAAHAACSIQIVRFGDWTIANSSNRNRREILAARIRDRALAWAVAAADAFEIDRYNILQASRMAMLRAVRQIECDYLLVERSGGRRRHTFRRP